MQCAVRPGVEGAKAPVIIIAFKTKECQLLISIRSYTKTMNIHSICEIGHFVRNPLCKLGEILRSRVLLVVCHHEVFGLCMNVDVLFTQRGVNANEENAVDSK